MSTTKIIFGPPGTGKTTELLSVVGRLIDEGTSPSNICFIAFTRKAAREAKERAISRFSLEPEELAWFSTMHSLAFKQLKLDRTCVMGVRDYLRLCQDLGLSITLKGVSEDGTFAGLTKGDRLFFMENMARARMMDLKQYWESVPDEDVRFYELLRLRESLQNFKTANEKRDFTDIIYEYIDNGELPPCRHLIVDEAQDLSPLQWRMVHKLSEHVESVHVAGDDDQAIFRWAGADPDSLSNLPGERQILDQSYRVPRAVQSIASNVVGRISQRVDKAWAARPVEGLVEREISVEHIDMSKGTWLLLARNAYMLEEYAHHCLQEGLIFDYSGESPIGANTYRAIAAWEDLRRGELVPIPRIRYVYEMMSTRIGITHGWKSRMDAAPDNMHCTLDELRARWGLRREASEPWHVALDKVTDQERQYFLLAISRGERASEPRIKISTIHSAKGGEADNVVLQTDVADRTWVEFERCPDDEHRVWYVAVTRARERLIIISPRTNKYYDL